MKISVTSPRKGMGQTITAINLNAMITRLLPVNTLLIDTNSYCKDVEYYLSDTNITKGLDDFCSLYKTGLLSRENFATCVKNVHRNMDIMASNHCFEIGEEEAAALLEYSDNSYGITVIDTSGIGSIASKSFIRDSDIVVLVLNQMRNIVRQIADNAYIYKNSTDKIIFIVNRYTERENDRKISYQISDIREDLKKAGFENPVFCLDYDVELINECNNHSVLNYVLNNQNRSGEYLESLEEICKHILVTGGYSNFQHAGRRFESSSILRTLPVFGMKHAMGNWLNR